MKVIRITSNPTTAELLSGRVNCAVLQKNGVYIAWTKTKEGPPRYDYPAAMADLRDMMFNRKAA